MTGKSFATSDSVELNEIIDKFESTWSPALNLEDFLPVISSSHSTRIFCELVRVDLELRWSNGETPEVQDYLSKYSRINLAQDEIAEIAFEEYRLREQFGQPHPAAHFAQKYGIDVSNWPNWTGQESSMTGHSSRSRLAQLVFPKVGDHFHDFELVGQLGQGAFGRVYLARQHDLANRFVALKVTEVNDAEPQALARLQHTNIVPIHSLRRDEELQAICMPFLGLVTLRDVIRSADTTNFKSRGKELISTVAGKRASTISLKNPSDSKTGEIKEALHAEVSAETSFIEGMNYQDMIFWMMGRIADGLAYSHTRGVVHGDMKPGNILISDDGQPMILDFHLSTQQNPLGATSLVGGTLPYMSARHLATFDGKSSVDESCDIFSLGVMLYEAMTGRFPYPARSNDEAGIHQMIRDRAHQPILVRNHNPAVSAGAASIIDHCISPHSKYQSAEQLRVDIDRHLANLPLRFAPNRSLKERASKWWKRHPQIASISSMMMIGIVTALVASIVISARLGRAASIEATQQSLSFVEEIKIASQPLTLGAAHSVDLPEQNRALSNLLDRRIKDNEYKTQLARLPVDIRDQEHNAILNSRYWLARSLYTEALNAPSVPQREELLRRAIDEIDIAKLSVQSPVAFVRLQSDILQLLGESEKAQALQQQIKKIPVDESSLPNRLLQAAEYRRTGDEAKSLAILKHLAIEDANSFPVWLMMGHSYLNLGKFENAEACYTVCIGLDNHSQWGFFSRGIAHLEERDFSAAVADFDRAILIDDSVAASFLNRALALRGMRKLDSAISDLTRAIEMGCRETRALYIRHELLKQLGKPELAQADLDEFLKLEPSDEKSWLSRGIAQIQINKPNQALADFQAALKLNPRSQNAYQNIATVQAEYLDQTQAAIGALTEIIKMQPKNEVALATRGVLHARVENRDQAIADAKAALKSSRSADTRYRVAGIFSLLSKSNSADANVAVELLQEAAVANGKLVLSRIDKDRDLDAIRSNPSFEAITDTLKTWAKRANEN